MRHQNITVRTLLLGICITLTALACTKASGPDMNYGIPSADSIKLSLNGQALSVNWEYPSNGELEGFSIQVAQDESFKKVISTDTLSKEDRTFTLDSAGFLDAYFVRILAICTDVARNSEYAGASAVFENVAQQTADAMITGNTATISWGAPFSGAISVVQVYPDNSAPLPLITLNATDKSNKQYKISGLSVSTHYTVLLLDAGTRKGLTGFTTKATADVTSGN